MWGCAGRERTRAHAFARSPERRRAPSSLGEDKSAPAMRSGRFSALRAFAGAVSRSRSHPTRVCRGRSRSSPPSRVCVLEIASHVGTSVVLSSLVLPAWGASGALCKQGAQPEQPGGRKNSDLGAREEAEGRPVSKSAILDSGRSGARSCPCNSLRYRIGSQQQPTTRPTEVSRTGTHDARLGTQCPLPARHSKLPSSNQRRTI